MGAKKKPKEAERSVLEALLVGADVDGARAAVAALVPKFPGGMPDAVLQRILDEHHCTADRLKPALLQMARVWEATG